MDYLSFYFTSWRCALSLAKAGDIIVAKTDPPMISLIGMAAAKQRGAKLVNWVQDVYPEIAIEFGVPFLIAPVRRLPLGTACTHGDTRGHARWPDGQSAAWWVIPETEAGTGVCHLPALQAAAMFTQRFRADLVAQESTASSVSRHPT